MDNLDSLEREYYRRLQGGDPRVSAATPSDRWGNRVLLSNSAILTSSGPGTVTATGGQPPARTSATIVSTRQFPLPRQISVGVRWALNDPATNAPVLPFSSVMPPLTIVQQRALFRITQSVDPLAANFTDQFSVGPFPEEFPLDVLTARQLSVSVSMPAQGAEPSPTSIWVEVIAGLVDEMSARNTIPGWSVNVNGIPIAAPIFPTFVAAAAVGVSVPLLAANPGRTQFLIQNLSTDADLLLHFGGTAAWGPPIVGSIVLPRNQFSIYESPVGGFTGGVTGMWSTAAPTGGALVTQGAQ